MASSRAHQAQRPAAKLDIAKLIAAPSLGQGSALLALRCLTVGARLQRLDKRGTACTSMSCSGTPVFHRAATWGTKSRERNRNPTSVVPAIQNVVGC